MKTKRILLVIAGIPLLLGVLLCGMLGWAVPVHNLQLWQLGRTYTQIPHPPDSTALQSYRAVGILDGAGNHCDFLAGEQRVSSLPLSQLQRFYADHAEVRLYHSGAGAGEDSYLPSYIRYHTPGGWPPGSYAVYLYDGMYDPSGDIRCH